jgi:hypothetical protein
MCSLFLLFCLCFCLIKYNGSSYQHIVSCCGFVLSYCVLECTVEEDGTEVIWCIYSSIQKLNQQKMLLENLIWLGQDWNDHNYDDWQSCYTLSYRSKATFFKYTLQSMRIYDRVLRSLKLLNMFCSIYLRSIHSNKQIDDENITFYVMFMHWMG